MNKMMIIPLAIMILSFVMLSLFVPMTTTGTVDDSAIESLGWSISFGSLGSLNLNLGVFSFGALSVDLTSNYGLMGFVGTVGIVIALFGLKIGASGTTKADALSKGVFYPGLWMLFMFILLPYFAHLGEIGMTLLWLLTLCYSFGALIEIIGGSSENMGMM